MRCDPSGYDRLYEPILRRYHRASRRAVALEYCVTSVGDGHGTTDDGALRHDQIVAHHNNLLCKIYHPDTELVIKGAKDISFS